MGHRQCLLDSRDVSVSFSNSLHESDRNITDHRSISAFKGICFVMLLSLFSTSGAYGTNVLSRLKEQFTPSQWLASRLCVKTALRFVSSNYYWIIVLHWDSYRFLTLSFVDYRTLKLWCQDLFIEIGFLILYPFWDSISTRLPSSQ